jgi:hypothetical protein
LEVLKNPKQNVMLTSRAHKVVSRKADFLHDPDKKIIFYSKKFSGTFFVFLRLP